MGLGGGRHMIRALIAALILCAQSQAVEPTDWPYSAVCDVSVGNAGGSGCLVAVNKAKQTGVVISAAHVFEDGGRITITFPDGYQCGGKLLGTDSRNDLAAVAIPIKQGMSTPRKVRAATKADTTVIACGFPWYGDGRLHWTRGKYLGYSDSDVHFSARPFLHSGFSGGALFSSDGDYLGATNGYGDDFSYAASGDALIRFVSRFARLEP